MSDYIKQLKAAKQVTMKAKASKPEAKSVKLAAVPAIKELPTFGEYVRTTTKYTEFGARGEIFKAFADCLPVINGHDYRNTQYFCMHAWTSEALKELCKLAMPGGYNGFTADAVYMLTEAFGSNAQYFIAREGSPAIYVRPFGNVWLAGARAKLECIADEVGFDGARQLFRFWWD